MSWGIKTCLTLAGLALFLASCSPNASQASLPPAQNPVEQAALEATTIVQQARSTALVMQAQKEAAALLSTAQAPNQPVASIEETPTLTPAGAPDVFAAVTATPSEIVEDSEIDPMVIPVTPLASVGEVHLLGVGFAVDGGFLMVSFLAPPAEAAKWYQGTVSLIDEASGTVYNEIPVIPVVGPMVGRPVEAGQRGYVMLVNSPTPLQSGARVTVILGDYRFEHIPVQ